MPYHRLQTEARAADLPDWDEGQGALVLGGVIVKQYNKPAANQRTILRAFQARNWPTWIGDPLEPDSYMDNAQRLADAVYHLNKQQSRLIRFYRDGTGKGICWKLVKKKKR